MRGQIHEAIIELVLLCSVYMPFVQLMTFACFKDIEMDFVYCTIPLYHVILKDYPILIYLTLWIIPFRRGSIHIITGI